MRRFICHAVLVGTLAIPLAGCDNTDESIPTTPTPPTMVTTQLTGSLTVNGAETKTFAVGASGSVTALLRAVARQDEQSETITVGMSLGTWNGVNCQVVLTNDNAAQGATVIGNVSGVGTLCVRLQDVGRLTGPINYTVEVTHPQ